MIYEKVRDIIVDTLSCDIEDVTMEASLFDDLGADSLDAVELNMAFEDGFAISIPEASLEKMKTVGDVVKLIEGEIG